MLPLVMYIMYNIGTNQVIYDRWKGPSDMNTLNIVNGNVMLRPQWWQILEIYLAQIF